MTTTVTLITATMNSARTIARTMQSVAEQDHRAIEHIVVDGASTDATLDIVSRFDHVAEVMTEPDDGIYQAFNRGLAAGTGQIVGFINSDDWYAGPDVIGAVVDAFDTDDIEATIGDVAFVDERGRRIRRYGSRFWRPWHLRLGLMPPHPAFFTRRRNYERFGAHREDLRIAADYDVVARLLYGQRLAYRHIPRVLVHMSPHGRSNTGRESRRTINREVREISADLDIDLVPGWVGLKYLHKTAQQRPRGLMP